MATLPAGSVSVSMKRVGVVSASHESATTEQNATHNPRMFMAASSKVYDSIFKGEEARA
jgi:hypothetical protein